MFRQSAFSLILFVCLAQQAWATPPSTPGDLRFTAYGRYTLELFWNRSVDNEFVGRYEVSRNGSVISTLDGLSLMQEALSPDTVYTYKVIAIDNEGNRSQSTSIVASTRPGKPRGLRALVYSSSGAELFWDRSQTVQPLRYEISRDDVVLAVTDGVSFFDNTLQRDMLYQYKLVAIDPNSSRSALSAVTVSTQSGNPLNYFAPVAQTAQVISQMAGDDGAWQAGVPLPVPRFTSNSDGTFKDNLTGLIWLSVNHCINPKDWESSIMYANTLAADGVNCDLLNDNSKPGDWRLPNVRELQSLIDYSARFPAFSELPPYIGTGFPDYPWDEYWTSTTLAVVDAGVAWVVSLQLGHVSSRLKNEIFRAWPVRGNQ